MWFDSAGGQLYVWYNDGNTTQWVIATNAAKTDLSGLLPLAGGTMTGPITLAADPVSALQPATKQYVDGLTRARNRVINGDFTLDQRNGGSQIPMGTGYIVDRWKMNNPTSIPSKGNIGRVAISNPYQAGFFEYCMSFVVATAYTPAAADRTTFFQIVEQINFADAQWGTPNAQPITVEFWASVFVAGTYSCTISLSSSGLRSYVATFALPATTWTKVRLTIPGDTGGTWAVADNLAAVNIMFPLAVGATYQTSTPNTWLSTLMLGAVGAPNITAAVNNYFNITGVALMVGAAAANAEPNFKSWADNRLDCLRYYLNPDMTFLVTGYNNASAANYASWLFPVAMRTPPTVTPTTSGGYINCSGLAIPNAQATGFRATATVTAAGNAVINFTATIDADF
jgi:hypothetical protein